MMAGLSVPLVNISQANSNINNFNNINGNNSNINGSGVSSNNSRDSPHKRPESEGNTTLMNLSRFYYLILNYL